MIDWLLCVWNWIVMNSGGLLVFIVGFAAFVALRHLIQYRREVNYNILLTITTEIADESASSDRGKVKEKIETGTSVDKIRPLIIKVRENAEDDDAEVGRTIERTIVRMDRVGFFLIGHRKKPITEPQEWLWTMTNDLYDRLVKWVEYRQTKKEDKAFYQKGYALYFTKLANEAKRRRN